MAGDGSLTGSLLKIDAATLRARKLEKTGFQHKPSPFSIRSINGYNPNVPLINLNNNGSTILFYAAINCGVLYNWTTNEMKMLQGHKNFVTCIASDLNAGWIVTGDTGPENIIIIWDCNTTYPCRTIFEPHGNLELSKLAMSPDAKYLLTLAYPDQAELRWWIWSSGLDAPHAKLKVDVPVNSIVAMGFNPAETKQFLLMTRQEVWIGVAKKIFINERGVVRETDDYELKIRKIPKNVNIDFGCLTCFTFVKNTKQTLLATSKGAILVFGYTIEYNEKVDCTDYEYLRFIKALKLEKYKINVISSIDGVIVTGNENGEIHFYNEHLMLVYWIHNYRPGCVKWLSFNVSPRSYLILDPKCKKRCLCWEKVLLQKDSETGLMRQLLMKQRIPGDASTTNKPFVVRDFIISTHKEGIGFMDFVTEKVDNIINYKPSYVSALSVHPEKPLVCIGYEDGCVALHNFVSHRLIVRLDLRKFFTIVIPPSPDSVKSDTDITIPELSVSCLKYSPSGLHLACGLNTGRLLFFDPTTIDVLTSQPEQAANHALIQMSFSPDSLTLAIADSENTILVYKYDYENFIWAFIGKHRGHYKDIATVMFIPKTNADGEYKLITMGHDRIMVEYDVGASKEGKLELYSLDRFDQTAVPLTGIVWPNPTDLDAEIYNTDLPLLLVANDEYKYKIINYETTMTLATVLGPRYSTPVRRLQLVNYVKNEEQLPYLIFATNDIIGLQKLPLDGNPWKHCGILAHPTKITEMCFREDFGYLFTIGAKDTCMTQWAVKFTSPETISKKGGIDLEPYYCLIEGGRPGWLFQEIRDLFYYIQIQCQGIFSPAMRRVKDCIPIESLADLMRAIGFYPSEYEVENLMVEAQYNVYQRDPSAEVNFEEFVKLYINHRPAFGESFDRLKQAFLYFADTDKEKQVISRDNFLSTIKLYGECFPKELACYLLSVLFGHSFEDRSVLSPHDFSFLPQNLTFHDLMNLLGIEDMYGEESPSVEDTNKTFE